MKACRDIAFVVAQIQLLGETIGCLVASFTFWLDERLAVGQPNVINEWEHDSSQAPIQTDLPTPALCLDARSTTCDSIPAELDRERYTVPRCSRTPAGVVVEPRMSFADAAGRHDPSREFRPP